MSLIKGKQAEKLASEFLQKQGLKLIECNYFCKMGEIDLIMIDQEELVFIEVKARQDIEHGHAYESVNKSKINKITKTAKHFLMMNPAYDDMASRFDIIDINFFGTINSEISWLKNAFILEHFSVY